MPITKKQVDDLKPHPFEPCLSWTRYRNGQIVPRTKPRYKRTWSFEGTHEVTTKTGEKIIRPGQYVVKMKRP